MMRAEKLFILLFVSVTALLFIGCKQQDGMFTSLSTSKTHVDFVNKLEKHKAFGILYYLYYYNGGGVATGDINNDGLPDIYFTANSKGNNKLYLNKGNFEFEDITAKAGVAGTSDWCTGVTMADINGDGYLDIYVSAVANTHNLKGRNELFINNRNGSFTESAAAYGLDFSGFTTQVAFFDYDHDGDLDCYMLNQSHKANENIVDTSNRRRYDSLTGDRLYRNDLNTAAKKFIDVSAQAGIYQSSLGYGLGIAVGDVNNDGWDDIYIGNDFHENDYYYVNNHNGTFTEEGSKHFGHYSRFSMGNDIADFNNDGQLDIVTVDMLPGDEKTLKTYGSDEQFDTYRQKILSNGFQNQNSRNTLQMNNGNGSSFSDVGLMAGVAATDWSWCPLFADFDNDGNKDLFITSGIVKRPVDLDYIRYVSNLSVKQALNKTDEYDDLALEKMPDGASHPFLYKGDGAFNFEDVSEAWGTGSMKGYFNGAAYADLDNDGNLDLVVNSIEAPAIILKNNAPKKNSLQISFEGNSPNNCGVGAKAYVFTGAKMQYQQLMLTRGFESSSDTRLHFGLDSNASVDSILVVWPDQQFQLLKNIPANKPLIAQQTNASGIFSYNEFFKSDSAFTNITAQVGLNWKHHEDNFIDFNVQYLIPHEQSTRGPKLAVADVNNDGLDDIYACGAKGQAGALFIQTKDGKFTQTDTSAFIKNVLSEEVSAVFFDANKDGFKDLLVVSGGNEYANGDANLADHLYINNGKGDFTEASSFPKLLTNKSTISVADIDNDGDTDVFIGTLCDAKVYGVPQTSYLLINDGNGNFTTAPQTTINLTSVGMVTSGVFADINNDNWPDLILSGEWMPLKIFINNKGKFTENSLPQSTGLWQNLTVADVNGDGFNDILAGNWGHNSKLWAGKQSPLQLYIKDFDKNGSVEQIMTYKINDEEYTFLAKDELEKSLPVLKKYYLKYNEVAGKTVQYMFYDLFKDYTQLQAETLSSSAFINDGKGNFTRTDLPGALQLAPIFYFVSINKNTFLAGGNFFGVLPYEGQYDALMPTAFSYNPNTKNFNAFAKLNSLKGELRDIQNIRTAKYGEVLVIATNNNQLSFIRYNNK